MREAPATTGFFLRDLRSLFPRLRQADRDRLFPARHLTALAPFAGTQRPLLLTMHGALYAFARCRAVFSSA